ncbi:MAG: hypothetical protein GXO75_08380 [Calditrichaeota bacterium]|nr:hypothetical protein [Calditrichota bacterium]
MCNCIEEIEKGKVKDQLTEIFKKEGLTVEFVEFIDKAIVFSNEIDLKTISNIEIKVNERKRKIKRSITHNFCPFCGQKYESKKEDER